MKYLITEDGAQGVETLAILLDVNLTCCDDESDGLHTVSMSGMHDGAEVELPKGQTCILDTPPFLASDSISERSTGSLA